MNYINIVVLCRYTYHPDPISTRAAIILIIYTFCLSMRSFADKQKKIIY